MPKMNPISIAIKLIKTLAIVCAMASTISKPAYAAWPQLADIRQSRVDEIARTGQYFQGRTDFCSLNQ